MTPPCLPLCSVVTYIFLMEDIVVYDWCESLSFSTSVGVTRVCERRVFFVHPGLDALHDLLEGVGHHFLHLVVGLVKVHQWRSIEVTPENYEICLRVLDELQEFICLLLSDLVVVI